MVAAVAVRVIALVPEGPLHPADLGVALLIGVLVAVGWMRSRWLVPAAAVVALAGFGWRYDWLTVFDGFVDRPRPGLAVGALSAAAVGGWQIERRFRRRLADPIEATAAVTVVTVVALGVVWGTVPDTEAPLMLGTGLVPIVIADLIPGFRERSEPGWPTRTRWSGTVLALAVVAAAVGSVGRPARFVPALAGIGMVVLAGGALVEVAAVLRASRSQAGPEPRRASLPA
jgi:hypothetical protein